MAVVTFIGLLLVIVYAAYLLSRGAEVLAERWGHNIVGSIILALVTTLPEYAFVFWASMKEEYSMAIGSAIGSCTLLITLGYGLVIMLATSRFSRNPVTEIVLSKNTRIDAFYLMLTGVLAFAFIAWDDTLSLFEGIVLSVVLVGYVVQIIYKNSRAGEREHEVTKRMMVKSFIELTVGGVIIYFASEPFVDSMIHLAQAINVSPVVIAIVLGPLASEMPEKLTAYLVVLRNGHNAELSVANFLGSKVNHNSLLLAVMPFVAHFKGHDSVSGLMSINFIIMTCLTVVVSGLLVKGRLQSWQGWLLILAYVGAMIVATQVPVRHG